MKLHSVTHTYQHRNGLAWGQASERFAVHGQLAAVLPLTADLPLAPLLRIRIRKASTRLRRGATVDF